MTSEQIIAENKRIADLLAMGVEERLRAIPGVLHVSIGLKQRQGAVTNELCIRVYPFITVANHIDDALSALNENLDAAMSASERELV